MLLSFYQKSKSLLGVGASDKTMIETAVEAASLDVPVECADELRETIYDIIRSIRDPEKPATLEDLNVVYEDCIMVKSLSTSNNNAVIRIEFNPTVPHCSLATLIGLCIRIKLERNLVHKFKLDIFIKKGAHTTEDEINKQINDKERISAAMENPELRSLVEKCILEED